MSTKTEAAKQYHERGYGCAQVESASLIRLNCWKRYYKKTMQFITRYKDDK